MANGVTFIRRGGRVIPIRSGAGGAKGADTKYGHFAAGGAAGSVIHHATKSAALAGNKKAAFGLAAAGVAIGLAELVSNIRNSREHANKTGSLAAGAKRFGLNYAAGVGGHLGTNVGLLGLSRVAVKARALKGAKLPKGTFKASYRAVSYGMKELK